MTVKTREPLRLMFGFIAIKAARALATLLICVTAVFVVLRLAGDPADMLLPDDTPAEIKAEYRIRWGLERSIPEQYWRYMAALGRGDLGISFADGRPAAQAVIEAVPNTFLLGVSAITLALFLGFSAGIFAALRHNQVADRVLMAIAVIGFSIPSFFFAILLILAFSLGLRWLPAAGTDTIWHMILPTMALSAGLIGKLARFTRTAMLDVLGQAYMRTAKAKGVGRLMGMLRHAMPNAAAPILMFLGIEIGLILTNATVIETIFAWPGLGRLLVSSAAARDLPVVQGVILLVAFIIVLCNVSVDILHASLDPRLDLIGRERRA